jgi:hypothetical protein
MTTGNMHLYFIWLDIVQKYLAVFCEKNRPQQEQRGKIPHNFPYTNVKLH